MKTHRRAFLFSSFVVVAALCSSCRGMQIRDSEKRIDQLESRVSALEAKVEMLSRK